MDSREARVGTLVRLVDGRRRNGKGSVGRIERTYGHPDYLAVDVRFDDGARSCAGTTSWHGKRTPRRRREAPPMTAPDGDHGRSGVPGTPFGYRPERDADALVVRRPDGSSVAAFGAGGADPFEADVREDAD